MDQNNISLEKVIKGLECCEHLSGEYCRLCPYHEDITADTPPCCTGALAHDALALLKAQEPVKPLEMEVEHVRKEPVVFMYKCPVCLAGLQRHWVACPICGMAVKWE